ncbi:MAG: hypothetical protein JRJ45_09080 [Deltaproteobacteria bacterium]|nr:hypothetical protein [Deltaproteobacteria bacterium]
MLFFKHRKNKDKRSHKERRVPNNAHYMGPEHRSETERRKNKDRRNNGERRKGFYHKLSDQQKTTMDGILNRLEDFIDEEKNH